MSAKHRRWVSNKASRILEEDICTTFIHSHASLSFFALTAKEGRKEAHSNSPNSRKACDEDMQGMLMQAYASLSASSFFNRI